ncbi:MAG: glycosyltransferase [Chloroflexota bacterium]
MLNKVDTAPISLADYRGLIGEEMYRSIVERSRDLAGLRVAHLNATPQGGGVAELLKGLIPLKNDVGLEAAWYTMPPNDDFFKVTKQFHNFLQGKSGTLPPGDYDTYLRHNEYTAELMRRVDTDVWVIHDPQPLATVAFLGDFHPIIWRCHIDTSNPNAEVQSFLLPYIGYYDEVIFSLPEYVFPQLPLHNVHFFAPAIDPLTQKNRGLPKDVARDILRELGLDPARPIVTQVSRFDPWKDPWGVIDAYRVAKQRVPTLQLALVGVMAAKDDPEALTIAAEIEAYAGDDPDIHLFTDPTQVGDLEVNAFQSGSDVILQKSIREGFGLTVAEAMWKGTPVVGGNCGGIRLQIADAQNGFLVCDPDSCCCRIVELLQNPDLAARLGKAGKESVRQNYLLPRLLSDYLNLLHKVAAATTRTAA